MFDLVKEKNSTILQGKYTTRQAADVLKVTTHQVVQLIHAGEIEAVRTAGNAFLIDVESLAEYARMRQGRGRPLSPNIAWAALLLLSGLEVDWLTYQQSRRLRITLQEVSAKDLVWLVRKRADLLRLRIDESFFDEARKVLAISGSSSDLVSKFGLTTRIGHLEGYIVRNNLEEFVQRTFAVADERANASVRVVSDVHLPLQDMSKMPIGVVAVDLASSSNKREHYAGLKMLESLLEVWRG
ncbi:MAG: helix-turn-helix domain-containing protein [Coriobacteriia bacterium]|nr:helix-turn-helix domain-containing protein [Coriobacteriia bacterium]